MYDYEIRNSYKEITAFVSRSSFDLEKSEIKQCLNMLSKKNA
jgi:hypothetical protein